MVVRRTPGNRLRNKLSSLVLIVTAGSIFRIKKFYGHYFNENLVKKLS